jgi:hypothetical protein
MSGPGRTCPTSYRYSPRVFDRTPDLVADAIYVVGGLYGNLEALDAVVRLAAREAGNVRIVFNGDFHWFDVDEGDFAAIERGVAPHPALRGNVETEIASEPSDAGCGCAYPADVSDTEVSRSNVILERLRETARRVPGARERLAGLPMQLVARVGEARIGIVHGDAVSLAGWGFAHERLDDPAHQRWIDSTFRDARVDAFASTHTCLPAFRRFDHGVIANNGAAGMPNFADTQFGLLTRIGRNRFPGPERLYGVVAKGAFVDAVRVDYDHHRWLERFASRWPRGSPAHDSYFNRISRGTRFKLAQALPRAA